MQVSNKSSELLAKAALFNGIFSIDWLLNLSEMKVSQILAILDEHVQSGILKVASSGFYCFINTEKQESYAGTFSEAQKEKLHRRIIDIFKDETLKDESSAITLSRHLLHISNDLDGCQWLIKAGDLYSEEVKYKEAIQCYAKVIRDLDHVSHDEADLLYIETVNKYMNLFSVRIDSNWATTILQNALTRAEAINSNAFLAILNMHMAVNQWQRANFKISKAHYDRGWAAAQSVEDPKLLKSIYTLSAFFYYLQGRFLDTIKEYEKSVQNVEKFPEDTSLLFAIAAIGRSYSAIGQANQGLGMLDAIRKHCLKINQLQVAEWAVLQIGYILKGIGRIDDAHKLLADLGEETIKSGDARLKEDLKLLQALIYYWKEDKEVSVTRLKEYFKIVEENEAQGIPTSSYGFMLQICWAMELEKYPRIDDISLEEAVNQSISGENTFYKGYGFRYKALLQKQNNQPPDVILKTLNLSLRCLEKSGHRLAIARTRIEVARQYLAVGDENMARKTAKKAASTILSHKELQFPDDLKFLIKDIHIKDNLLEEILKLGQEITTIRNTKDIEKHIILTAIQVTGAERGAIFLLDRDRNPGEFLLRAAKNLTEEDIRRSDFREQLDMMQQVAKSGKGVIKKLDLAEQQNNIPYNVRSYICVPMIIKNEIIGVLYFDNRFLASAFKKSDLDMFTYFAAQTAIAMDNAEAYDEVRRLNRKLRKEKQYYKERHLESLRFDKIIGESPVILNLLNKVIQVADTDTTVLITGETGVGKELVARTIVDKSPRSDKPFISVNCSVFSETLIASELFGHEKGAYTGANEKKAGRFELADGGTLFLDEIGDIPMEVQVRLLRVLQVQEFERVGGTKTLYSDFRLIVATNQNLENLVKAGRFREDLFYRLNVFPIHVPPLRKRKADIPPLTFHFLKTICQKMGKNYTDILESEMEKLVNYNWPGNVRELENVIERGVIMSTKSNFRVPELKKESQSVGINHAELTLMENEKRHILWALERTGWKISGPGGAAELLDINYGTLRSRIAKLGIKKKTQALEN
ncbi:MAG: sigma 54-interacting transcriptional regulator [Deltaproteobacteria bacterium]|nr:sigma 54-interacting transcriptional regulator [Deltaproteobacteria bacterium]